MARRLLDSLFFSAQDLIGTLYYEDGASDTGGRRIEGVYQVRSTGAPSPGPGSALPTSRTNGVPGDLFLPEFCENLTGISLRAEATFPFASLVANPTATLCAAPVVVCDLAISSIVTSTTVTLTVTTSNGPWTSSLDGAVPAPNQTTFTVLPGQTGTIVVVDAANCRRSYSFQALNPANPQPPGDLLDYFAYGAQQQNSTLLQIYGLRVPPYTVTAWSPTGVAIPASVTPGQRGRQAGYEFLPRCVGPTGTTQLRIFATYFDPFVRVEATENAASCGYVEPDPPTGNFQFVAVQAGAESAAGGDGYVQASVTGNDGPVLFSLDNFQTPGTANADGVSVTINNLFAGAYVLYARETRPLGRTITRAFTVGGPVYGLRYEISWRGTGRRCGAARLYLRAWAGPVEKLLGGAVPLEIDYAGANASAHFFSQLLAGSEATLRVVARPGDALSDLDVEDERTMRVDVVDAAGALVWRGWQLPDLYRQPHLPRPHELEIRATDGLGALAEQPFVDPLGNPLRGEFSHWRLLRNLMGRLQLELPWVVLHTLYPALAAVDSSSEPLQLVATAAEGFADSNGKPYTCEKVLLALLDYHALRVQQRQGTWFFERLPELYPQQLAARLYSAAGQLITTSYTYSLLRVVVPPPASGFGGLHWQHAQQQLSRLPAVATVEINAEPGKPRNFFPGGDFPATAFSATDGRLLAWTGPVLNSRQPDPEDDTRPAALRLKRQGTLPVQTLDSPPFRLPVAGNSLVDALGGPAGYYAFQCVLSFTARLATLDFNPDVSQQLAAFYVGFGTLNPLFPGQVVWLARADPEPGSLDLVKVPVYELTGTSEVKVSIPFRSAGGPFLNDLEAVVRFYGSGADDVLVSNVRVTIGTATNGSFVNSSSGQTRASRRLTRRDDSLTLQLADTLNPGERVFSVLDRSVVHTNSGQPVDLWREGLPAATATPPAYLIDLLVRDRLGWQQRACWVLSGVLAGDYSPGALLVDPAFEPNTVLVNTTARWNVAANTWQLNAVENLLLTTPRPAPAFGLLTELRGLLLDESLAYTLVPEDAY